MPQLPTLTLLCTPDDVDDWRAASCGQSAYEASAAPAMNPPLPKTATETGAVYVLTRQVFVTGEAQRLRWQV